MLSIWSAKGGVGCSTVASALALMACEQRPRRQPRDVLLVDLGGDLPAVLGIDAPSLGLVDWLVEPLAAPDALGRIEAPVVPGLQLLPLGPLGRLEPGRSSNQRSELAGPEANTGTSVVERSRLLFKLLAGEDRLVVVDTGKRASSATEPAGGVDLLKERACAYATDSVLVTRCCYLSLIKSAEFETPSRVVVVAERGRSLTGKEVTRSIGAPLGATVRWDPATARSVDAGLVVGGVPRSLRAVIALAESQNS